MKIVHGGKATYYTQRGNELYENTACGFTSAINALVALGYKISEGKGQPEDRLLQFAYDDAECQTLCQSKPMDQQKIHPLHTWQDVIALAINRWLGMDVARFIEACQTARIFAHVAAGGAALVTGEFQSWSGKTLSHTIALIGLETFGGDDLAALIRWYIRDSWGDHRTLYKSHDGRLIDLKPEEFMANLYAKGKPYKWAILIDPPKQGG